MKPNSKFCFARAAACTSEFSSNSALISTVNALIVLLNPLRRSSVFAESEEKLSSTSSTDLVNALIDSSTSSSLLLIPSISLYTALLETGFVEADVTLSSTSIGITLTTPLSDVNPLPIFIRPSLSLDAKPIVVLTQVSPDLVMTSIPSPTSFVVSTSLKSLSLRLSILDFVSELTIAISLANSSVTFFTLSDNEVILESV